MKKFVILAVLLISGCTNLADGLATVVVSDETGFENVENGKWGAVYITLEAPSLSRGKVIGVSGKLEFSTQRLKGQFFQQKRAKATNDDVEFMSPGKYFLDGLRVRQVNISTATRHWNRIWPRGRAKSNPEVSFEIRPGEILYLGSYRILAKRNEIGLLVSSHNSFEEFKTELSKTNPIVAAKLKYHPLLTGTVRLPLTNSF